MVNKKQINFFNNNGYLIIKNFYSSKELYKVKAEIILLIEEIAKQFSVDLYKTQNQDIYIKKNINILKKKIDHIYLFYIKDVSICRV